MRLLIFLFFPMACWPVVAQAEEEIAVSPDDIVREIEDAERFRRMAGFDLRVLNENLHQQLDEKIHFSWTTSYLSAALASTGGNGSRGASGELNFQGVWDPTKNWFDNSTQLRFRVRHRHAYGGEAASEISGDMGALWGVVNGFSAAGFEVPDFFFLHDFKRIGLEMRYGQMSIDSQFGGHQLASSRIFFLNQAFASNPGVAFPRFGAGLTAVKRFDNGLSIGIGSTTIQGTQVGSQVDLELGSGDLFKVAQLAYEFEGSGKLKQRFALLGWRSDAVEDTGQPSGQGTQLTYERALNNDGALLFSTLAWANGGANPLDQFLTGGLGVPCREEDFAGLAVGIGQGAGFDGAKQGVLEGFYRWQATENLQLTPDIQILLGEKLTSSVNVDFTFGLRLSARF